LIHFYKRMSEGGPGWTLKPLTEIKPSSFGKMKQLEKEYGHGDYGDLEKKIPNANDPLFKYVKNHLLPKPRESRSPGFPRRTRNDLEDQWRSPRALGMDYETNDKGLSLLRHCLDELPQDRKATIAGDMGELKRELREKARRESELAKSKMQPNSAHKVYAWRGLLEDRETLSSKYSCQTTPSELFMPENPQRRLDIFVRPHTTDSKIHLDRNLNCWSLSKLGPPVYRDNHGLKIIPNLDPEVSIEPKGKLARETDYHYSWPFVDPNSGESIASYSKLQ